MLGGREGRGGAEGRGEGHRLLLRGVGTSDGGG